MPGARVPVKSELGGKGMEYAYVEVMACPGGCTNGGGQIKGSDVREDVSAKEWLGRVDEAYFSLSEAESEGEEHEGGGRVDGQEHSLPQRSEKAPAPPTIRTILTHWSTSTGIPLEKLAYTSYRSVESDVGKEDRSGAQERVVEIAGRIGGGW